MNIGINGFGRIGKCIFLQCLEDENIRIKAININHLSIHDLRKYIHYDSVHRMQKYDVEITDNHYMLINGQRIKIFNERNPALIPWTKEHVVYLFETTGVFLTKESILQHDVRYVLLSAPPKDDIPIYCYGVNDTEYSNERVVSGASCTTNCIAPFLKLITSFTSKIIWGSFITIHAATASQQIADKANMERRTHRSLFNIIPHKTGASSCIDKLMPELKNKIFGTCVRVPTQNVSMIDLDLIFEHPVCMEELFEKLLNSFNDVVNISFDKLVSTDFIGDKTSCIIDYHASKQLTDCSIKFTLWYDNEWSYSAQIIRLLKKCFTS